MPLRKRELLWHSCTTVDSIQGAVGSLRIPLSPDHGKLFLYLSSKHTEPSQTLDQRFLRTSKGPPILHLQQGLKYVFPLVLEPLG